MARLLRLCLIVALLLLNAYTCKLAYGCEPTKTRTLPSTKTGTITLPKTGILTLANILAVHVGMSYLEVVHFLGRPLYPVYQSFKEGLSWNSAYLWQDPAISIQAVYIVFELGRATEIRHSDFR